MAVPSKIYLDTNLLYGWCENKLRNKKVESETIKFLSEKCQKIEKFISMYSVAELLVGLKKEIQGREISMDKIGYLFVILRDTIGLRILFEEKLTEEVIRFAELCRDHNDAIHIQISKNENLTLITHDTDVNRVEKAYPSVMSIGKLMKQFD